MEFDAVGITPRNSACYDYNPERARELLKQANYDDSEEIVLRIRSQRVPKDVEYAEAVVTYWAEVGLNVDLQVVESSIHAGRGRSNCGHGRSREEFAATGADGVRAQCIALGPGKPDFALMELTAPATSTESLDFSRQGILRNSCFSRSSGICEDELQAMIEEANATPTGDLRTARMEAIADHVHDRRRAPEVEVPAD